MAARAGATVVETPGSHSVYVSQPQVVAGLISQAARDAEAAAPVHVDPDGGLREDPLFRRLQQPQQLRNQLPHGPVSLRHQLLRPVEDEHR
jgi:hypothetical protein